MNWILRGCLLYCFFVAACIFAASGSRPAEEVRVAAASDLNFAIGEIIQQFERNTGNKVRLTLGSSGNFYAQIVNGAPFDIFLSADTSYPHELEERGLAIPGSTFTYGMGALAIWTTKTSPIKLGSAGMKALS